MAVSLIKFNPHQLDVVSHARCSHRISSQNFCTLSSCPSRCARQRKAFEGRRAAHLRPCVMSFEAGKLFVWGDVLFGQLTRSNGGHVAIVTRDHNSNDERFLELRIGQGSQVWEVRRGGSLDTRKGRWDMHPDNFPAFPLSIVRM